jgi:hypothetical protein
MQSYCQYYVMTLRRNKPVAGWKKLVGKKHNAWPSFSEMSKNSSVHPLPELITQDLFLMETRRISVGGENILTVELTSHLCLLLKSVFQGTARRIHRSPFKLSFQHGN